MPNNLKHKPWFVFIFLGAVSLVSVAGYFVYTNYYLPKMEAKKKVEFESQRTAEFKERFDKYGSMISVALCQEVYDEYITAGSKERKGRNFFDHCKYRNEKWSSFKTITTVFSPDYNRADIKYTYDLERSDFDSSAYKDCIDNDSFLFSFQFCEKIAPTKKVQQESIETWLNQNGKWMRDY
jgi:hypothetical protein